MSSYRKTKPIADLRTAEDWPEWIAAIRSSVALLQLGDYVNCDGKEPKRQLQEPKAPEIPTPPEEAGGEAAIALFRARMDAYLAQERRHTKDYKSYTRTRDELYDLLTAMQASVKKEVGLERDSADAQDATLLITKVRSLLRIDDPNTRIDIEDQWTRTINVNLSKTSLTAWRDEVIMMARSLKRWDSKEVAEYNPHREVIRALKKRYVHGASEAQSILSRAIKAREVPDFEPFFRDVIAHTLSISTEPGPKAPGNVNANRFQGKHDASKETFSKDQNTAGSAGGSSRRTCLACGRENHDENDCYDVRDALQGRSPRTSERKENVTRWLADPQNKARAEAKFRKAESPEKRIQELNISSANALRAGRLTRTASATQHHAETLRNSVILDSGTDGHLFNDLTRFTKYEPFNTPVTALAGDSTLNIEGRGTARVYVKGPDGPLILNVENAYYSSGFHTNVIATALWADWGIIMCEWTQTLRWKHSRDKLCDYWRIGALSAIEEGPSTPSSRTTPRTTPISTAAVSSKERPAASHADVDIWHRRLGHPGPEALEQCSKRHLGTVIKGPQTNECQTCAVSKAHKVISRVPQEPRSSALFGHVSVDLFPMNPAYNGDKYAIVMMCRLTRLLLFDAIPDRHHETLLSWIMDKTLLLQRQADLKIRFFQCDGESGFRALPTQRFFTDEGIEVIETSPYSSYQNGSAERLGQAVMTRVRCLLEDSGLPETLWPETAKTTAYLHNRLPHKALNWDTPIERMGQWLRSNRPETHGTYPSKMAPNLSNLKVYGCRAYPLTREALQGMQKRRLKTHARAQVGYLVGYKSSTQYVIWVPAQKGCIVTPHVTFDERITYRDAPPTPEPAQLRSANLPELFDSSRTAHAGYETIEAAEDSDEEELPLPQRNTALTPDAARTVGGEQGGEQAQVHDHDSAKRVRFLTPDSNTSDPPHDCITVNTNPETAQEEDRETTQEPDQAKALHPETAQEADREPRRSSRQSRPSQKARENNRTKALGRIYTTIIESSRRQHRRELPAPPTHHGEAQRHQFSKEWREAERAEITHLFQQRIATIVNNHTAKSKPLPLRWVYAYKFDKHGYLERFKARLCVRGDQQPVTGRETYAATLAARTFRTLVAIAARWNLRMIQYDIKGAFTYSPLDEEVWCHLPQGHYQRGKLWKLLRALYGLRISPLLWYKRLREALEALGLSAIGEDQCVFSNGKVIVFFYVDDIIIMFDETNRNEFERIERGLKSQFEMTGGSEAQWFLKVRITRDTSKKLIWLSQEQYIEKICTRFGITQSSRSVATPLPSTPLSPATEDDELDDAGRTEYQEIIGSIIYGAMMTRADAARAAATLARFSHNPGKPHEKAARHCLQYLYNTRFYALQAGASDRFECYSDASFADNPTDRKSSQGHLMKLFGLPIQWKAGRQDTVTTSSTEAELLALSHTAKEQASLSRLFRDIDLELDSALQLMCDNLQTIRLLTEETARLHTRLRHVDIHRHWLRQEVQQQRIQLEWVPTEAMAADGLTKDLPRQNHVRFLDQLGLVDLQ
ncbi:hypothetical protein IMZ48_33080, partial [Candidatus Bathyarchaeota archaeon]|nr:hypothetical protein [Candidatus Bathyarchaeota archaeon]